MEYWRYYRGTADQNMSLGQQTAGKGSNQVVTWHVIVWVLLTLAINSMTQPSGYFCSLGRINKKYRMYLCLSPILSLADAVSILLSILTVKSSLGTSIVISARYVWFFRLYVNKNHNTDHDEPFELWNIHRCIVFVGGTLPALLKLSSFSGLPWSKTWGSMFILSFILVESINVVATHGSDRSPRSEAAALCLPVAHWDAEVNRSMREEVTQLNLTLTVINGMTAMLAAVCHFILMVWSMSDLLQSCISENLGMSMGFPTLNMWIQLISGIASILFFVIASLVKWIYWYFALPSRFTWKKFLIYYSWCLIPSFLLYLHPHARLKDTYVVSETHNFWRGKLTAAAVVCYLTYKLLLLLCLRLPYVNRALLATTIEHQRIIEAEDSSDFRDPAHGDKVDRFGLCCVTGFVLQIGIGLLWYAYRYDPAGTSKPSWTDVLG